MIQFDAFCKYISGHRNSFIHNWYYILAIDYDIAYSAQFVANNRRTERLGKNTHVLP